VKYFNAIMTITTIDFDTKLTGASGWGLLESFRPKDQQTNEIQQIPCEGGFVVETSIVGKTAT
tara:strand:+ start:498 stop:686 length:189 start_codon:yes stop_codon:yes gene_type:complete